MDEQAVPVGWAIATLADIADLLFGQSPPSSTYNQDGKGVPFFQGKAEFGATYPTARVWCTKPTRLAHRGDILVSIRAPVGPTNLAPFDCAIGRGLAAIRPRVERDFVRYYLRYIETELAGKGTGTTFAAITKDILQNQLIVIAPLAEQRRIVAKIEELFSRLDEGEAALKRTQRLLAAYRQSVLKAAVTGELTKEWRAANRHRLEPASELLKRILAARRAQRQGKGKYKEPRPPETAALPELPEGWIWASVGQIGSVQLGRQRSPKNHTGPNMRPYLRAANATWNGVDLTDVMEMNFSPIEFERYRLRDLDILLSEASGSAGEVGKPIIWREEIPGCCFQNTLIRVQVDPSEVDPYYCLIQFQSDARNGAFASLARGIGIHHLGAGKLERFRFALPPLDEQAEIVDQANRCLIGVEHAETYCATELARSATLRQAILKAAFSGQLVPQDPCDEPAAALLERIRAARPATKPRAARRRTPKQPTFWESS